MALKNPFIVFEHDVYALTSEGEKELRRGETALAPDDIELMVRTDGSATVAEIAVSMPVAPSTGRDQGLRAGSPARGSWIWRPTCATIRSTSPTS